MKASLLMAREDVPDDDGLRVILSVHQWTEGHQVSAREGVSQYSTSLGIRITVPTLIACVRDTEPPNTMSPQNGILTFQVGGRVSPLKDQNGVPTRSGTRKITCCVPQQKSASVAGLEGGVMWESHYLPSRN